MWVCVIRVEIGDTCALLETLASDNRSESASFLRQLSDDVSQRSTQIIKFIYLKILTSAASFVAVKNTPETSLV